MARAEAFLVDTDAAVAFAGSVIRPPQSAKESRKQDHRERGANPGDGQAVPVLTLATSQRRILFQ